LAGMKLRLVTYNIHKGVGTDRRLRLDRVAEIVRHYDPHVVCLQEVTWAPAADGGRTQPQELADGIGLAHRVVGLNCIRRDAGVMNDWRHRLFADVLAPAGYRAAAGDHDDPGHSTYPSRLPVVALDKVFVHGAVKAARSTPSRLALARVASDHLPLVVELEV